MLHVMILAYNEAVNLPGVVRGIARVIGKEVYRIVIVDDGSTDSTRRVTKQLATTYPVVVVRHSTNRGVAEAFRTGMTHVARKADPRDILAIMEGEGTSSPKVLPAMFNRVRQGADIVIASRYQRGGRYQKFPLRRLILSKGANHVFQLLFPVTGVRDYSIFYRAYRVQPLQDALKHYGAKFITAQTFFANIDILLNLRPFVSRIEEVPFVYNYSQKKSQSSMKILANLWSYVVFMVRYAFRHRD